MLLDNNQRCIYIFGGQRDKEYLSDLYRYSITDNRITEITQDFSKNFGSDSGYTQRATLDEERQEIYMFSGYLWSKANSVVKNIFWVYEINANKWKTVYIRDNHDPAYWRKMSQVEPYPRFAHQMVFNQRDRSWFIFGGNPGDYSKHFRRLDDFWELHLAK
jgi:hypothetical protein